MLRRLWSCQPVWGGVTGAYPASLLKSERAGRTHVVGARVRLYIQDLGERMPVPQPLPLGGKKRVSKPRYQFVYTLMGYLLIGLALAVIGAVLAIGGRWAVVHHFTAQQVMTWFGVAGNTVAIFGIVIKIYRPCWRRRVFWEATASLLFLHTAGFWLVLHNVQEFRIAWFLLISAAEMPLFIIALDRLMYRRQKRPSTMELSNSTNGVFETFTIVGLVQYPLYESTCA